MATVLSQITLLDSTQCLVEQWTIFEASLKKKINVYSVHIGTRRNSLLV